MNSNKIKIDGENYLLFASENVKNVLIKNKVAAISLAQEFVYKPFTKQGVSSIKKIGDNNVCVLNIKAFDADEQCEIKCFVLHCVGNYTDLVPVAPNKWSVKLNCGHHAIIDETVDAIEKDHHVECYKCQKEQCTI